MKRHLFLTGPIGCGKSTAIAQGLGEKTQQCGGFLTRRYREPYLHFTLETPDGREKMTFLDFSEGKPQIDLQGFSRISLQGAVLILDEIGGIELLNPEFTEALTAALKSDVPILGVVKGEGPAGALIETLGLAKEYELAASHLRNWLRQDENTILYECSHYDETALLLVKQWTEEYLHD